MPYTLSMGLLWVLLAVLLGIVVGWLLRSVAAKRQIERARSGEGVVDPAELDTLRARVAELEPAAAERDRLQAELETARRQSPPATDDDLAEPSETVDAPATGPGLAGAVSAVGRPIERDDLTIVEGIDPRVATLCHGIGITTWAELADTEVSLLRTMLADAGPECAGHDPTSWPRQAQLLADGSWTEFATLADELGGGRAAT